MVFWEAKFGVLAEEAQGVAIDEVIDGGLAVAALFHFEGGFGDGKGVALAPVAGAVEPEALRAVDFDHVDGARRGAFGLRVKGNAGPKPGVEDEVDGVFLDVVDDDARGIDFAVCAKDVDDEAGAFPFVLEVGSVDEDHLVVLHGELDVAFEDGDFVAAIFVEADFADAEDVGAVEKGGKQREDFVGEGEVFGFLGIEAKPRIMRQAEFGGALRFVVGELAKVVVEALGGAAVEAGPEGGFADGAATGGDHGGVVVGGAANHVGVGFNVAHARGE